jgi:hypothetical protein
MTTIQEKELEEAILVFLNESLQNLPNKLKNINDLKDPNLLEIILKEIEENFFKNINLLPNESESNRIYNMSLIYQRIENYYEYIITIPPSLSHILEVRNDTVEYVIQYNADNITIEFLLGEEKMIKLSTYIKMIVNNYFLSDFNDKNILGDNANIQYELFDQIELYDEQNLIGLLTDVSSVSSGNKNYNVTYKSNANKIEGYIESFQYYSNKTLVENEDYIKSSYNGTITLKVCMLNCTNCPIVDEELVC